MYNVADRERILQEFSESIDAKVKSTLDGKNLSDYMKEGNAEHIRNYVKKIRNCFDSVIPVGIPIPKVSVYVTPIYVGDDVVSVSVSITNKTSSNQKFKFKRETPVDNATENMVAFFKRAYDELLVDFLIRSNLVKVNDVLASVCQDIELPYDIMVVSPLGNEGKVISAISDDEICFVADAERLLNVSDILVLHDVGGNITEEMMERGIKQLADELATTQTPEQLVSIHGGVLVRHLCNISKHVKPMTMIKKVCNRNSEKYQGNKSMLTYYKNDTIFSLLMKNGDDFSVVLSPFNINTFRKEDVDVVALVRKANGFDPVSDEEPAEDADEESDEDSTKEFGEDSVEEQTEEQA